MYRVSSRTKDSLVLGSNGSISYTPNADFHGTDRFVYRLFDGRFYSENATVTIDVASVNDAPTALGNHYSLSQDAAFDIAADAGVLANDSDIDADVLTVSVVAEPANGTVSLNADGSFVYTPNPGFSGLDTFTCVTNDGQNDSRISTVNLDVVAAVVGTKFFVVNTDVACTFEYAADGTLQDSYTLTLPMMISM